VIGLPELKFNLVVLREKGFPFVLALQAFLGSLQLLDALSVGYYPMIHRATNLVRFDLGVSLVLPLGLLLLFWVGWMVWGRRDWILVLPGLGVLAFPFFGLEACVAVVSLVAVGVGLWCDRRWELFFSGVLVFLCFVEGLALVHWVVFVPLGWASPVESVAVLERGLFYVSSYLVPLLVLPFMFMWVLKGFVRGGWDVEFGSFSPASDDGSRWGVWLLVFSLFLGVVAGVYPYLPAVNPSGVGVGVDIPQYVEAMMYIGEDLVGIIHLMRTSDRPSIYFMIYGFQRMFGLDVEIAVRYVPVLLNPLLVVSVYLFVVEVLGDRLVAGWAAFFTVVGWQVSVNMYSYFLTNMLGLSLALLSLRSFFRVLRLGDRRHLIVASVFGGLLVFTHSWTLVQYFASVALTAVVLWFSTWRRGDDFRDWRVFAFYLGFVGLMEVLKVVVFGATGGFVATSIAVQRASGLFKFWYGNIFGFRLLYGGLMSGVVLLGLALLGVLLLGRGQVSRFFLFLFMFASSLVFLVGNETIKTRLLFNLPVGLYAAVGFYWLQGRWSVAWSKRVFVLYVVLSFCVFLLGSLANLR